MWIVRVLTGPQAGKTFPLKDGKNKIGRGPTCDIQLTTSGVSKEHLEVTLLDGKIIFADLNSSNGSFLNGVKVKGGVLRTGDKLSIHDILIDIVQAQQSPAPAKAIKRAPAPIPNIPQPKSPQYPPPYQQQSQYPAPYAPNSYRQFPQQYQQQQQSAPPPHVQPVLTLQQKFENYIQNVVSPALYQLIEQFDFKFVLMSFVSIYVLVVTILAVIPMNQITSESITIESGRRAKTVARALASVNEKVLRSGELSNLSTDMVLREEGIDDVYIVGKDGRIIAPADRVGQTPKEVGFYRKYKEMAKEYYEPIGSKIGAAIPILGYDADLQKNVAKAYAVVIYNPGSMAFDENKTISLFVQMLALAAAIGSLLFFVLYKLIEYPYYKTTKLLDEALRDNKEQIHMSVRMPALQALLTNINTMLSRIQNSSANVPSGAGAGSKNSEYFNLLNLIGFPALMISNDGIIQKANSSFETVTNIQALMIENQKVEMLPDQAMQKNILELMKVASGNVNVTAVDRLEISGHLFRLSCQVVTTSSGEIDCYFLTISPAEGAEGNAA